MKVLYKTLAGLAVAGLIGTAVYAARPVNNVVLKPLAEGGQVTPTTSAMAAFNFVTGFESSEGYGSRDLTFVAPLTRTPPVEPPYSGWIRDQPCPVGPYCWGTTAGAGFSYWEGHVDQVHPNTGSQHLRISTDRTTRTNLTGYNLGIDARLPASSDITPKPNAPNTVSFDMAIDTPFGMDFVVQPQHIAAGYRLTQTLFFYAGGIYTVDSACGTVGSAFMPFGLNGVQIGWDTTGAYQNLTIGWDTCRGEVLFYYGGVRVFPACIGGACVGGINHTDPCVVNTDCGPTCMWTPGTSTDQLLVFGDNYPGSSMDVDDVEITMLETATTTCGDHFISYGCGEQCEIGAGEDTNCPGRCVACVCTPICTALAPCPLVNGANGPFLTSSGFYTYNGTSPFVEIDTCGSTTRSGGMLDTSIGIPDVGGAIGYNDDCGTGQYGAGSDPNASCYDVAGTFTSCTCVPGGGVISIEADSFGGLLPAGSSTIINVNKKVVCAGALAGACCDSNGHDGDASGCTDNVAAADCAGAFDTWYGNGKCAAIQCACIPDCAGRECGDDGCGGICLPNNCDDGNVCTDDSCSTAGVCVHDNNTAPCPDALACTVNEHCVAGACVKDQRVCNDNDVCNGVETCVEPGGCTNPPDLVWPDQLWCNGQETCDPILGVLDQADPCDPIRELCVETGNNTGYCKPAPIPTVSEWGIVALALLLLIGAKVYFGRRQATA